MIKYTKERSRFIFALNFTGNNTIWVIGNAQRNMTPTFLSRLFVDHDNEEAILEQKATNHRPVFIETEHELSLIHI